MFAAGASQWPAGYAAVVKTSLTLSGFGASLLLRVSYRALARRVRTPPALLSAAVPLSFGAAGVWMGAHNLAASAYRDSLRARAEGFLREFPDLSNTIYDFFLLLAWAPSTSESRCIGTWSRSERVSGVPRPSPAKPG